MESQSQNSNQSPKVNEEKPHPVSRIERELHERAVQDGQDPKKVKNAQPINDTVPPSTGTPLNG